MSDHDEKPDPVSTRLRAAASQGCAESRLLLSRRSMLGVTAGLFSWAFAPKIASASTADPRLLIVVLRGGMDGLSTVPYDEPAYYTTRRILKIEKEFLLPLANASRFGLHPSLKTFGRFYDDGDASIVHATCVPLRTRSHFDCQDNLENGLPGFAANSTGWLNRMLQSLPKGEIVRKQGAIEIGQAPLILRGQEPVLGWSASAVAHVEDPTLYMIRSLYRQRDPELFEAVELGLKGQRFAEGVFTPDDTMDDLQIAFTGAGNLLASPVGPRIATLSVQGWDTHTKQGGVEGEFADKLAALDDGLARFRATIGDVWSKTAVLIVTEFGRMVGDNGNEGSDHGVGTVALLAGGAVAGRKVIADWPGLQTKNLYEKRDLKATTDLRSVFKGVLREHLGVPDAIVEKVFVDSANVKPLTGLIKGA